MTNNPEKPGKGSNEIPWWVKSVVILAFTGIVCYKAYETPMNLQFDFPAFLALLLALFSVGLAALFYFKATETSNAFYDNTYKFSQEVGALLAKIESGFGERLRHLDEAYAGMRQTFDDLPTRLKVRQETQDELEAEEKTKHELLAAKDQLIEELMEKAQLEGEEKDRYLKRLKQADYKLQEAQQEIDVLRERLNLTRAIDGRTFYDAETDEVVREVCTRLARELGSDVSSLAKVSPERLNRVFRHFSLDIPESILALLENVGWIDEKRRLTDLGLAAVRNYARVHKGRGTEFERVITR